MLYALTGSLEAGVIYALMALGVYLTFRILDFPDLTVDGSFATGGAVAAVMITSGYSPLLATLGALLAGCVAGTVTGLLHTKGKINTLLSGIISMIALYSINLRIMGKANTPLLGENTLFTQLVSFLSSLQPMAILAVVGIFVLLIKWAIDWFLDTEIGLAIRATGDNAKMIRSLSANTDNMKIIGLSLSNGLVALSGALIAQYQEFADVSMGIGIIIIGLASVIMGEAVFGHASIRWATFSVIGGAILYRLIIMLALRIGLDPNDLKLLTAAIVVSALVMSRVLATWKDRRVKSSQEDVPHVPIDIDQGARGESHAET
ncbi:ABC transporter permease [Paenibacillus thiaminolyticus]|uniref:ABC transporter permease n=1 Tax=Paenibacillus thiaminolyticus TaxID=49283 RepID=UPI002543E0EA|nr:ABC transporter permease [Paenibacillus thiaminolyticus]WII38477.1 ABC transporter permease [Paenibacillus thiaminolyticus]